VVNRIGNINNQVNIKSDMAIKTFALNQSNNFSRELAFYKLCEAKDIKQVPHLLDYSNEKQEIIIKYIPGKKPQSLTNFFIGQVADFLSDLNEDDNLEYVPNAAEAILTNKCLASHLKNRLQQIGSKGKYHPKGLTGTVRETINILENKSIDLGAILINPSDLGLHNMILNNGNIIFYDFEYAGKDSYLKLLIDFCLHPINEIKFNNFELYNKTFAKALNIKPLKLSNAVIQAFCLWWVMRLINSMKEEIINSRVNRGLIDQNNISNYVEKRNKQKELFWNYARSF
jgi:hypothetical protein